MSPDHIKHATINYLDTAASAVSQDDLPTFQYAMSEAFSGLQMLASLARVERASKVEPSRAKACQAIGLLEQTVREVKAIVVGKGWL
jgi:hypothetical protein